MARKPKTPRNSPLTCKLSKGMLTISIGVETLRFAAERHKEFWQPQTDKCALVVSDTDMFASDVRNALLAEEEDGSTRVTELLDEAIQEAVEQGSEGLDYDAMEAIEQAEQDAVSEEGKRA